ncbi:MAG: ABC transporter substrate-binding protein [Chlorobiaceae bacterium]|nr:ABC transporter substrate-binding protein [Chlorobiaceae bacterium]
MMKRFYRSIRCLCALPVLGIILLQAAMLAGCGTPSEGKKHSASVASAPDSLRNTIEYARRFRLLSRGEATLLEVMPGEKAYPDTLRYLLVPEGKPVPSGFASYTVIYTPVRRIAVFSTTHIGFIDLLGQNGCIAGVSRTEMVNTPSVRQRIAAGKITEIGMPFSPDQEAVLALDPELVCAPVLPPSRKSGYQALRQMGVPVLVVADWLESSPLGRAEWVKLFGALLGKEELARERFATIESSYLKIAALSRNLPNRPTVLTSLPVKDTWYVPAGESYVVAMLRDAGASYHWRDLVGIGSVPLTIEAVWPVALEADYWLNTGTVSTLDELVAIDSRFGQMRSVKERRVWNNNRQLNAAGGNAYWESGVVRPDLILKDLVMILHPGLLRAHGISEEEFTFYREVK